MRSLPRMRPVPTLVLPATGSAESVARSGLTQIGGVDIRRVIRRAASMQRPFGPRVERLCAAMTIHRAKNPEFDHVAMMWPYTVRDDPEQKRRLLYKRNHP
jgi:UvrD-like helicase C-terminal domain